MFNNKIITQCQENIIFFTDHNSVDGHTSSITPVKKFVESRPIYNRDELSLAVILLSCKNITVHKSD